MLAACLVALVPAAAHAHGRPPSVGAVTFVPDAPGRVVARATFGLATSDDDGASWRWICAAAFGVDATIEDPDVLALPSGGVLLGTFGGLFRSRVDRCEWSQPALRQVYVIDLDARLDAPETVYAIATSGSAPDQLHVSFDGGETFTPLGQPEPEVLLERVRVAPSDPTRVYLSGARPNGAMRTRAGFFFRSEDGGETRTAVEVPLEDTERNVHLLAVDPSDPARVLVRVTRPPIDPRPERVLLTEDGGRTFTEVLTAHVISGAVFSADGARAWVTATRGDNADDGPPIGLFRSEDAGRTFTQRQDRDLTCVARNGDELWVCLEESSEGFSLGRSRDGGDTLEPAMRFAQLGALPACDPCSRVGIVCPGWFPDLAFDLRLDAGTAALPDGSVTGAPRDAAAPASCGDGSVILDAGPGGGVSGGCGCRVGRDVGPSRSVAGGLFALALLLGLRRRSH